MGALVPAYDDNVLWHDNVSVQKHSPKEGNWHVEHSTLLTQLQHWALFFIVLFCFLWDLPAFCQIPLSSVQFPVNRWDKWTQKQWTRISHAWLISSKIKIRGLWVCFLQGATNLRIFMQLSVSCRHHLQIPGYQWEHFFPTSWVPPIPLPRLQTFCLCFHHISSPKRVCHLTVNEWGCPRASGRSGLETWYAFIRPLVLIAQECACQEQPTGTHFRYLEVTWNWKT